MSLLRRALTILRHDGPRQFLVSTRGRVSNHPRVERLIVRLRSKVKHVRGVTLDLRGTDVGDEMLLSIDRGLYEGPEADAIAEHLNPTLDTIELGACVGLIACLANQRLNDNTTHVVVEPNKHLIPVLERNRALNGCDYEIFHGACSAADGPVAMTFPDDAWGGSLHAHGGRTQTVGAVSLTELIGRFDIGACNLIVDIEGAEAGLIADELDTIEEHCALLVVEFHDDTGDTIDVASDVRAAREHLEASGLRKIGENQHVAVYTNPGMA